MTQTVQAHNRLVCATPSQHAAGSGRQGGEYFLFVRCIYFRDGIQAVSTALRQSRPLPETDGASMPLYQADGQPRAYWKDQGKILDGKEAPYLPHDADPDVPDHERISIQEAARTLHLSIDRVRKIMGDTNRLLSAYHRMQPDWTGPQPHSLLRYFVEGARYYTTRAWLEHYEQRRAVRAMNAVERANLRERGAAAKRTAYAAVQCLATWLRNDRHYVGGTHTEIYPGPLLELIEWSPQEWPPGCKRAALQYLAHLLDVVEPVSESGLSTDPPRPTICRLP